MKQEKKTREQRLADRMARREKIAAEKDAAESASFAAGILNESRASFFAGVAARAGENESEIVSLLERDDKKSRMSSPDWRVRLNFVLSAPDYMEFGEEEIEVGLTDAHPKVRLAWMVRLGEDVPADMLRPLMSDKDFDVRSSAVLSALDRGMDVPEKTLGACIFGGLKNKWSAKEKIARIISECEMTGGLAERILSGRSPWMKLALAGNGAVTAESEGTWKRLLSGKENGLSRGMAKFVGDNPHKFPVSLLSDMSESEDWRLRSAAASHPALQRSRREKLASDANVAVRAALSRNENLSSTEIRTLSMDGSPEVRAVIASTHRLDEVMKSKLLSDSSDLVSCSVISNACFVPDRKSFMSLVDAGRSLEVISVYAQKMGMSSVRVGDSFVRFSEIGEDDSLKASVKESLIATVRARFEELAEINPWSRDMMSGADSEKTLLLERVKENVIPGYGKGRHR